MSSCLDNLTDKGHGGRAARARVISIAVIVVMALAFNCSLSVFNLRRVAESQRWVTHTQEVQVALERVMSELWHAETSQRGYVITGHPGYLEPYPAAVVATYEQLSRLKVLTNDTPEHQRQLQAVLPLVERKLAWMQRTIDLRRSASSSVPDMQAINMRVASGNGKRIMEEIRANVGQMKKTADQLLDQRTRASVAFTRTATASSLFGFAASLSLTALAISLLIRGQKRERRAAQELAAESDRLRTTLTSIGDAVMVTDKAGRVTLMNKVAQNLTGWHGDGVGRPLEDVFRIVNEVTRLPVENPVVKVLQSGKVVGLANHTVLLAQDGVDVAIDDSGAPIVDAQGRTIGVVLVFRDIRERKRLEEAHRLIELLQLSDDAILVRQSDGKIEAWNPAAERLYGFTDQEAHGRVAHELLQTKSPVPWEKIESELRGRRHWEGELVQITKDGTAVTVWSRMKLIRGGRVLESNRDLTERKRMEEARRHEEALREVDQRKNEFLGVLSHELRNPLTPIRNSLYILERAVPGGEQARRAKAVIDRQVNHLTRLVDDLLDVTRIARGKIRLQRAHLDLAELVRRTMDDYRTITRGREVILDLPKDVVRVDGDATRLAQVVGNLLSNAAKFTPDGGRITISLTANDARAILEVADTGTGIDQQTVKMLFEPFVQADRTLDRSRGGLGLGLALVKGMVVLHGGQVTAHSDGPGHGARFTVTLPLDGQRIMTREPRQASMEARWASDRSG